MQTFLCVHGMGGTRADWAGVSGPLERLGQIVCLNMPAGSPERGRDAIIHELMRGSGPGILVGHSRGGVLALMAAAERPDLVVRLAGMGLRPSAFDRIARAVRCPVLAISGERDSHVPSSWVGAAARRYGWSHVTLPRGRVFQSDWYRHYTGLLDRA